MMLCFQFLTKTVLITQNSVGNTPLLGEQLGGT